MDTRYGVRKHCLSFLGLPEAERFPAAKAAMIRTGFHWPDSQIRHWLTPEAHERFDVRQEALKAARDRTAGR